MKKGIPAHILIERLDFVLKEVYLQANAGNSEAAGIRVTEARDLVAQLRGAIS